MPDSFENWKKDVQQRGDAAPAAERELLAQRVAKAFHETFAKLAEHREDIEKLWREFEKLGAGEAIMGCTTKREFCERVLRRTTRAVQYLLTGGNPVTKRKPPRSETVSRDQAPMIEAQMGVQPVAMNFKYPHSVADAAAMLAEAGARLAGEVMKGNHDYAMKLASEFIEAYEQWKS